MENIIELFYGDVQITMKVHEMSEYERSPDVVSLTAFINGEMVKVDIDASYIDISPDFETLYKETGINSDVEFGFDELDANQGAVITYNDKEQMMKFKIIDKELMENKEEPNAKG